MESPVFLSRVCRRQEFKRRVDSSPIRVVFDMSFASLMTPRELTSIGQQIIFCYGANRRAIAPVQMHITDFVDDNLSIAELQKNMISGAPWIGVHTSSMSLHGFLEESFDSQHLMYLTSDSPTELEALEPGKSYIIGGLIDRNRHKSLCYSRACEMGLPTARLPLGPDVKLENHGGRKHHNIPLTVNVVFNFILDWLGEEADPARWTLGRVAHAQTEDRPCPGRRIAIPPAVLAVVPSPLPPLLQRQQVFSYDTREFPFRELVAEVLGLAPAAFPLLHQPEVDGAAPKDATPQARLQESSFTRRWQAAKGSCARQRFSELLRRFVTKFVAPRMHGEDETDKAGSGTARKADAVLDSVQSLQPIAYQRDVTFRVQSPSEKAIGCLHSDADYHHPPAEVNWWLPLTRVWDSNALHIESKPGRGDFTPAELDYGQVLRFYGNLCQHHTVANKTDSCRVSFDFRVLPMLYHDPEWVDQLGRSCIFKLGTYYEVVELDERMDHPSASPDM